jgi:hypothetical protein
MRIETGITLILRASKLANVFLNDVLKVQNETFPIESVFTCQLNSVLLKLVYIINEGITPAYRTYHFIHRWRAIYSIYNML